MPIEEEMLAFVEKHGKVSEKDLQSSFGVAWEAAYHSLFSARDLSPDYGNQDAIGCVSEIPGTIYLTSKGHVRLSDFKEKRRLYKRNLFWTRVMAVIALLISAISLAVTLKWIPVAGP